MPTLELTEAQLNAAEIGAFFRPGQLEALGITYDRTSYKWPGHSPGEIISFRTPEGVKRQGDFAPAATDMKEPKRFCHSAASLSGASASAQNLE